MQLAKDNKQIIIKMKQSQIKQMTPNVTLAGRKSDHNLQIEGSLSETRGKESSAQKGQNEPVMTEQQSENQISHIYQNKQRDGKGKKDGPQEIPSKISKYAIQSKSGEKAQDKNTDLGGILSPPRSKKMKRNQITAANTSSKKNSNIMVRNESYKHITPKASAIGSPRPQLSNVLKLQAILPNEENEGQFLINTAGLDPCAQSQGQIAAESHTFGEDKDILKRNSSNKVMLLNNNYSRKVINLQPGGYGATANHSNQHVIQADENLLDLQSYIANAKQVEMNPDHFIIQMAVKSHENSVFGSKDSKEEKSPKRQYQKEQQLKSAFILGNKLGVVGQSSVLKQVPQRNIGLGLKNKLSPTETRGLQQSPSKYRLDNSLVISPKQNQDLLSIQRKASQIFLHQELSQQTPVNISGFEQLSVVSSTLDRALVKNSSKESLQNKRYSVSKRRNTTIAATLIAKRLTRDRVHVQQSDDLQLELLQQKYLMSVQRLKDLEKQREQQDKKAIEAEQAPPRVSSLGPGRNVVINPGKSQRVVDSQFSYQGEPDGTISPLHVQFQNQITDQSDLRDKIIDLIKASGEKTQPQSPSFSRGPSSPVGQSPPQSPSSLRDGRNLRAPYPDRIHPDRVKLMQKQLIEKKRNIQRIQHMVVDTTMFPQSKERQKRAIQSIKPSSPIKGQNPYSLNANTQNSRSIESLNAGDLNSTRVQKTKGANFIDQKSILEYIDKKVVIEKQRYQKQNLHVLNPKEVKAPDQRFLSPLAMPSGIGKSSFDQRKKSYLRQKQYLSQQHRGDPGTLLQYLNENLEELDHTILEQSARNQKVQFALQLTTPQDRQPSNFPTPISPARNKIDQFWDKSKISKNNINFLKDQLDTQDALTGKHLDIQGPNYFEHKLKNVKDQHKYNSNINPLGQQPLNDQLNGMTGRNMASPLSIDKRASPLHTDPKSRDDQQRQGSINKNGSGLSENPLDVQIVEVNDSGENTSNPDQQRANVDTKAEKLQNASAIRNSPHVIRGGTKTTQLSIDVPQGISNKNQRSSQKLISKIVTDKLVIEDLKVHKPYGAKWVNNKDPDIYESELYLSQGGLDEANQFDKRHGSGTFMKLIGKLPSQMDNNEARQQDMDLDQIQGDRDGTTTMARATLFNPGDVSINGQSGAAIDEIQYMDETRMEFSTSLGDRINKVKDGIAQQNQIQQPQQPSYFRVGVQIAKNDPKFKPQYQTNNLQYKHQMDLKKKLVGAPLSPMGINLTGQPGHLNTILGGIIGGPQGQQMTFSKTNESMSSGVAADYLNSFSRDKRQQAAIQQMLTFDSGKQQDSPNTSKGLPYKQVIQTQRERHQGIKVGTTFKQSPSQSNLFAHQRRPTYGNPMQAQIQVTSRISGTNSPAQEHLQTQNQIPMRQVVVSHHKQSSIQPSNEMSRSPSYLKLQVQTHTSKKFVMLKQPDISPTINRDNEDYGTKMMEYNDMSNNALQDNSPSPIKMQPRNGLYQENQQFNDFELQDSSAYLENHFGYDEPRSPLQLKSPKIEVKEFADGRQVLKIQEQYAKELAKGGIYYKGSIQNQNQPRKPVILRHKRLSKNLNQNHNTGQQFGKPQHYKLDGTQRELPPRELPAGLVQAISEYNLGTARNTKPLYRGGQPTMQKLAIATNRQNLGVLQINSRDNSPLMVRGDIGALAYKQQARIAAENARNKSKSDKWTLEISPFQQTHSGEQNNNFHQLSNYQEREAKEMLEAENENSVSEEEIFEQNYKQEVGVGTGSPLTAFLPQGFENASPTAFGQSPSKEVSPKIVKDLHPSQIHKDELEGRILINDDSDDEGEPAGGQNKSPRKTKLVITPANQTQEQKFVLDTEQRIFEELTQDI